MKTTTILLSFAAAAALAASAAVASHDEDPMRHWHEDEIEIGVCISGDGIATRTLEAIHYANDQISGPYSNVNLASYSMQRVPCGHGGRDVRVTWTNGAGMCGGPGNPICSGLRSSTYADYGDGGHVTMLEWIVYVDHAYFFGYSRRMQGAMIAHELLSHISGVDHWEDQHAPCPSGPAAITCGLVQVPADLYPHTRDMVLGNHSQGWSN